MGKINAGRVFLGGLRAGVVICVSEFFWNGIVFGDEIQAALVALNRNEAASSAGAMALYVAWAFLIGILAVWVYAAARPRFGAGPRTAVRVALMLWLLVYVQSTVSNAPIWSLPAWVMAGGLAAALLEIVLATLAGAWLYREQSST